MAVDVAPTGDRAPVTHLPGGTGMWVFVLGDLVIFSGYFVIFMFHRSRNHDLFLESQRQLDQNLATVNTLLLLAGSWFVARAVQAARERRHERATRLTGYGGLCGLAFVLVKVVEWSSKLGQGLTFTSNDFFMFYYALTGVHVFHVVLGLVILGVVVRDLRGSGPGHTSAVEAGAIYWHLVDLLWIMIFALVYVLR